MCSEINLGADNCRFPKAERLYLNAHKERLFASKNSFVVYPFRVIYASGKGLKMNAPCELIVSVPKRKLKRAVDRNLVKRRTKEAYRLKKMPLYKLFLKNFAQDLDGYASDSSLLLGLIYLPTATLPYEKIDVAVEKIIEELISVHQCQL